MQYNANVDTLVCDVKREENNLVLMFITQKEQQRHHLHHMIHHSDPPEIVLLSYVLICDHSELVKVEKRLFNFCFISIIIYVMHKSTLS